MSTQHFLVEIGTEELPPKSLKKLSTAFSKGVLDGLTEAGLSFSASKSFARPSPFSDSSRRPSDTTARKVRRKTRPVQKSCL